MGRAGSEGTPGIGGFGIARLRGGTGGTAPLNPGGFGIGGGIGSVGTPGLGGSGMASPRGGTGGAAKPGGVGRAGRTGRVGTPGIGGFGIASPSVIAGRLQLTYAPVTLVVPKPVGGATTIGPPGAPANA